MCVCSEMEIVPEGKNFRLVTEDELPAVADHLVQYMPESLKVNISYKIPNGKSAKFCSNDSRLSNTNHLLITNKKI